MIQDHMGWRRQSLVKESFLDDLGLLLVLIVHPGVLLIVEWDLVSLHEVVAEVNRQQLRVLHLLLRLLWQVLMIDVFLRHVVDISWSRSGRNLVSRPRLISRILRLGANGRLGLLNALILRHLVALGLRLRLLLLVDRLVGDALHLLQLLLLQDLLQGGLGLAVQGGRSLRGLRSALSWRVELRNGLGQGRGSQLLVLN